MHTNRQFNHFECEIDASLFETWQLKKCQQGVLSSVASSQAAAVSDGTTTPNSFFARFSF